MAYALTTLQSAANESSVVSPGKMRFRRRGRELMQRVGKTYLRASTTPKCYKRKRLELSGTGQAFGLPGGQTNFLWSSLSSFLTWRFGR